MNTNTKYWSFTWQTNKLQKKIPEAYQLQTFLDKISDEAIFQLEEGSELKKLHIQGTFTLLGLRQSKKVTLELFKKRFGNVHGLTISPVFDKVAIVNYVTKQEGRVSGPFYAGVRNMYDKEFAEAQLRPWQTEMFGILTGDQQDSLKDRKVIWVQDSYGNTGKSWFQKWLRVGQHKLTARSIPVASVERLTSAVCLVNKQNKVDLFMIDFTRSKGRDQSYEDLFATIEQIKNGYVVDVMYGKYNESVFKPPMIIIFTNNDIELFYKYLSPDRWKPYLIQREGLAKINLDPEGKTFTPISTLPESER